MSWLPVSSVCLVLSRERKLKFNSLQNSLITYIINCPKYESAYKEEELARHGIGSLEVSQHIIVYLHLSQFQECRGGNFKGNSTKKEREIFEDVTFSFDDIVENVTIRFPMKRKNKKGERRRKTVKPKYIASKEIRYLN